MYINAGSATGPGTTYHHIYHCTMLRPITNNQGQNPIKKDVVGGNGAPDTGLFMIKGELIQSQQHYRHWDIHQHAILLHPCTVDCKAKCFITTIFTFKTFAGHVGQYATGDCIAATAHVIFIAVQDT